MNTMINEIGLSNKKQKLEGFKQFIIDLGKYKNMKRNACL